MRNGVRLMIIPVPRRRPSSSTSLLWLNLFNRIAQWPHADLLEPDDVAWVMILQAEVAHLRALWLPFGFVPLLPLRHIAILGIKVRYPSPIQVHRNASACQGNDH